MEDPGSGGQKSQRIPDPQHWLQTRPDTTKELAISFLTWQTFKCIASGGRKQEVFRIRIGFNAFPNPAFDLNTDPDPGSQHKRIHILVRIKKIYQKAT